MHKSESMPVGIPRSWECVLAICGLIVLFPLIVLSALLVRFSSRGPIFFRQDRVGFEGKTFTLYKFRTMKEATSGLLVTAAGDSRITKFGRILRKTKLDELPEIFNVVRGDMSLVGPRPEVVDFVDYSNPQWKTILSVRPGITDPATLCLRNEEVYLAGVEDKVSFYRDVVQPYKLTLSIDYLETRTFLKDISIILRTFQVIIFPRSAPFPMLEEIKLRTLNSVNIGNVGYDA
jgi:lipopolysaccharide/colanic/teichoic acid biosynthesis glycosyltransferase